MEKIETTTEIEKVEIHLHKYYCDKCNKFIEQHYEYYEGLADTPKNNEIKLKIFAFGNWYIYERMYCDECIEDEKQEIIHNLKHIGFKKDQL